MVVLAVYLREEIIKVIIIQIVEIIFGAATTIQRLAISDKLDICQASSNTAIAFYAEGVEIDDSTDVAAGVNHLRVSNPDALAVNNAGRFNAGRIDKIAMRIGGVFRTLRIAVTQRRAEIRRNSAAPLGEAILRGQLDALLHFIDGLLIILADEERAAVLEGPSSKLCGVKTWT